MGGDCFLRGSPSWRPVLSLEPGPQIRAACLELGDPAAEYAPPITFMVVQKRHHTRFFPSDPRSADRSGNVPPGTDAHRDPAPGPDPDPDPDPDFDPDPDPDPDPELSLSK